MVFDEKTSSSKLFNSSSDLLNNDPFDILKEFASSVPVCGFLTGWMNYESTHSQFTMTIEFDILTS